MEVKKKFRMGATALAIGAALILLSQGVVKAVPGTFTVGGAGADFATLTAAIASATVTQGSTLRITGSTPGAIITKKVVIEGLGGFVTSPGISVASSLGTFTTGLQMKAESSGSLIRNLVIKDVEQGIFSDAVDQVVVEKCIIFVDRRGITLGGPSVVHWTIKQNCIFLRQGVVGALDQFGVNVRNEAAEIAVVNNTIMVGRDSTDDKAGVDVNVTTGGNGIDAQISGNRIVVQKGSLTAIRLRAAATDSDIFNAFVTGNDLRGSRFSGTGTNTNSVMVQRGSTGAATDLLATAPADTSQADLSTIDATTASVEFASFGNLQDGNNTAAIPAINSGGVSPTSVTAGSGASVTITGTNFDNGAQLVIGTNKTMVSGNVNDAGGGNLTLQANIPSSELDTPGTLFLMVKNEDGSLSEPASITVNTAPAALPQLNSLSPNQILAVGGGDPNTTVLLNGANFLASSVVNFNGGDLPGGQVTFISDAQLSVSLTAANVGSVAATKDFFVKNGADSSGTQSLSIIIQAPQLFSISPNVTSTGAGVTLTLNGSFRDAVLSVLVDAVDIGAATGAGTSTRTKALTSAQVGAPGTRQIQIVDPVHGISNAQSLTVTTGAPAITSLTIPVSAQKTGDATKIAAGGPDFQLTVTGTGFGPSAVVIFNGNTLPVFSRTGTTVIVATVGAFLITNPATALPVKVKNFGPDIESNTVTVDVAVSTPTINTVSPTQFSRRFAVGTNFNISGVKIVSPANGMTVVLRIPATTGTTLTVTGFSTGGGSQNINAKIPSGFVAPAAGTTMQLVVKQGGFESNVKTITVKP